MKKIITLSLFCFSLNIFCQTHEKKAVQNTIEAFFEGFHNKDSLAMRQTVSKDIILQSISKDKDGKASIKKEEFSQFLKYIVSIPETISFEEKLLSINIQIDGDMANAWTTYDFWFNGQFSHCGVNSFQLVKIGDEWKIIYLIDTRRKEGCTN